MLGCGQYVTYYVDMSLPIPWSLLATLHHAVIALLTHFLV